MKTITIQSGNLSKSGKNFTGYDPAGNRIHIPLRQLESAKLDVKSLTFPLYAIVVEKTFDVLAEKDILNGDGTVKVKTGEPTGETFTREQTGSIFTSEDAMIAAFNSSQLLATKAESQLLVAKQQARVDAIRSVDIADLTENQLALLTANAF
jgi:hypothetical protein